MQTYTVFEHCLLLTLKWANVGEQFVRIPSSQTEVNTLICPKTQSLSSISFDFLQVKIVIGTKLKMSQ